MITSSPPANAVSRLVRGRQLALLALFCNLLLVLLFPPYDYVAMEHGNVPTFEGFRFFFSDHRNRVLNSNFLWLEVLVVLINFFVAWLLLQKSPAGRARKTTRGQRVLLVAVALNLVVMLLFPPFENFIAISKAVLPSFEGFYFIFADNSQRQLVTPILYLEVAVVLINAALLWLFLQDRSTRPASASGLGRLEPTRPGVQKP